MFKGSATREVYLCAILIFVSSFSHHFLLVVVPKHQIAFLVCFFNFSVPILLHSGFPPGCVVEYFPEFSDFFDG